MKLISGDATGTAAIIATSTAKPERYRIVQLRVGGRYAIPVGRTHGKARLAAPPFVSRRGLTLPLADSDGNVVVRESNAGALEPPHGHGALWPLE